MKKNGFTLMELLAVIIILAIIALIATPIVINIIEESKENATIRGAEYYIDAVEYAVLRSEIDKTILEDGVYTIQSKGSLCLNVNASGVCENGEVVIDFKGEAPKGGTISLVNGVVTDAKIEFKNNIVVTDDNNKLVIFEPVCVLASDSTKIGTEIGAKYLCKVKDEMESEYKNGYTFYVLSTNNVDHELITEESTDKTVKSINLILDRYINSDGSIATELITKETNPNKYNVVAWNNEPQNFYHYQGPITVMNFLYNATKNWTKVEPINFSYVQSSYAGITSVGGDFDWAAYGLFSFNSVNGRAEINGQSFTSTELLRARLPIYYATYSGLTKTSEKGEVADFDGTNQFIYENDIKDISGYWLLSGYPLALDVASVVFVSSKIVDGMPLTTSSSVGARPVITVNIDDIK